jgi:Asp-tRNA(Asn)/Glu-tRNA(Gln) amidotransferase A subunit family amidase
LKEHGGEIMGYDLKSVRLPRLTGRPLQLFAAALEMRLPRAMLAGRLLRDAGLPHLRELTLSEPPTFLPIGFAEAEAARRGPDAAAPIEPAPGRGRSFPFPTARDYTEAYRAGTATPEQVAQRALEAIAASDAHSLPLRAFIACDRADVLAQARASAERWRSGRPIGPLDGVPVAVKDEVDQVPYPTTAGTSFLGRAPAAADSTAVARLRAAGALLLGKTNMHEIGINPTGLNVHYGIARNPFDRGRDPGGSSSGSAVAVAAGLCPIALGADGGGSIRIPAALCGQVGLKATFGRVSEHGAAPLCWSVGHLGPIGATVEDVALAYAAMAGPDPHDPNSLHQPPVRLDGWDRTDLEGVVLGVYRPWSSHAAPWVVAAFEAMLERLVKAGATIREVEVPELDAMRLAHAVSILSEMASSMKSFPQARPSFGAGVRVSLAAGNLFTAHDYVKSQRMRTRAISLFRGVLGQVDAIVTPATAIPAPPIPEGAWPLGWSDLSTTVELMRYVFPANLTGLPAISFPAGYDEHGLPLAMQAMGRWWEEALILRIAHVAEQGIGRRLPSSFWRLLP